ncbi:hypothetical protein M8J76_000973 [Diaphorina citri]|nr:hypothetical protein M8J75_006240 [Diaphorina citri]KAI5740151.1 hypothetical protein M8J76_000973 [Diaphorina citri]
MSNLRNTNRTPLASTSNPPISPEAQSNEEISRTATLTLERTQKMVRKEFSFISKTTRHIETVVNGMDDDKNKLVNRKEHKKSPSASIVSDLDAEEHSQQDDADFVNSICNDILQLLEGEIDEIGSEHDENAPVCRICHGSHENLKALCECRGTMGLVHAECLTQWLSESGRSCCEICNFKYKFKRTLKRPLWETMAGWLYKVVENSQVFIILSWLMAITPIVLLAAALCVYCLRQIFIYSDRTRAVHPAVAFFTFTCSLTLVVWYYDMLFMIVRAYFENWHFYYIRDHDIEIIFPERPEITDGPSHK